VALLGQIDLQVDAGPTDRVVEGYKMYQILQAAIGLGLFDWLEKQAREILRGKAKVNPT